MSIPLPWDMKYQPKTIDEYIFHDQKQKDDVSKFLEEKTFPHLLLSGHRGTGKTSLSYLLKNSLGVDDIDFLKINASKENGVDVIRNKVISFVSSIAMSNDFKIVLLDEADRLSPEAQKILKGVMEDFKENARFILTTNHTHKIDADLKSRIYEIRYEFVDKDEMTMRFATILKKENIKITDLDLLDEYVESCYPDFRKLLITAQTAVRGNVLPPFQNNISDTSDYMLSVIEYIENDDWHAARVYLAANVPDNKWEECYRFLYDYLHDIGKFKEQVKWKAGIITIADYLYRHSIVADPEMNFAACLIKLSDI
jgi:replication factor C small subunit